MRPELDSPLGNPTGRLPVLYNVTQRTRTDHRDWVSLEILPQLPACHKNAIYQLLPMRIPLFGLDKYFTDIVNRSLNRMFLSSLLSFYHHRHTDCSGIRRNI